MSDNELILIFSISMATNDFLEEIFWLISWLPTYFLLTKFQEYPSTTKFHHFLKSGGFLSQPLLRVSNSLETKDLCPFLEVGRSRLASVSVKVHQFRKRGVQHLRNILSIRSRRLCKIQRAGHRGQGLYCSVKILKLKIVLFPIYDPHTRSSVQERAMGNRV